ncbi:hypothetical protein CEP82_011990 [Mobiluncus mulieris]|nr:hypothetical protein CEP82_011990 [Mobiluncus mulieris]
MGITRPSPGLATAVLTLGNSNSGHSAVAPAPGSQSGTRTAGGFTDLFAFWTFMERFSGLAEIGKCPDLGFSKTQGIDVHGANKNRYSGSREPQS